jgi:hypothetical protein
LSRVGKHGPVSPPSGKESKNISSGPEMASKLRQLQNLLPIPLYTLTLNDFVSAFQKLLQSFSISILKNSLSFYKCDFQIQS